MPWESGPLSEGPVRAAAAPAGGEGRRRSAARRGEGEAGAALEIETGRTEIPDGAGGQSPCLTANVTTARSLWPSRARHLFCVPTVA